MEVIGLGLETTTLCPDELITDTYSKLALFSYTLPLFIREIEVYGDIDKFGDLSHKCQDPTEQGKITDFFVACKIQGENMGLKAETKERKERK